MPIAAGHRRADFGEPHRRAAALRAATRLLPRRGADRCDRPHRPDERLRDDDPVEPADQCRGLSAGFRRSRGRSRLRLGRPDTGRAAAEKAGLDRPPRPPWWRTTARHSSAHSSAGIRSRAPNAPRSAPGWGPNHDARRLRSGRVPHPTAADGGADHGPDHDVGRIVHSRVDAGVTDGTSEHAPAVRRPRARYARRRS
jgi:hypothetical protein